jgi:hypothetical protein
VVHRAGRSDSDNGIGDIEFWPLMLGWAKNDFKYDVRCGIYAPSGAYDSSKLANTGLGYWTIEPEVTFSYMSAKSPWSSKIGTEVSLYSGVDFNTENNDTNYTSGTSLHFDLTVAQHLPLWGGFAGIGANAFYYDQITGDSGSGARLGDFKGMTTGVGPVLSYIHPVCDSQLLAELKWLPELDVDKRMKGDYIWFKLGFAF